MRARIVLVIVSGIGAQSGIYASARSRLPPITSRLHALRPSTKCGERCGGLRSDAPAAVAKAVRRPRRRPKRLMAVEGRAVCHRIYGSQASELTAVAEVEA
jgi:hypothetical protein